MNYVKYPSNMLSIQKSTTSEIRLLTCGTYFVNWSVQSVTPLLWKSSYWAANSNSHSCNIMGNFAKKISWISEYRYHCNQFPWLSHEPSHSFCTNINIFDPIHSSNSLLVGFHNIVPRFDQQGPNIKTICWPLFLTRATQVLHSPSTQQIPEIPV